MDLVVRALNVIASHPNIDDGLKAVSEEFERKITHGSIYAVAKRFGFKKRLGELIEDIRKTGSAERVDVVLPNKHMDSSIDGNTPRPVFNPQIWTAPPIKGKLKWLVLGDLHAPCQSDHAINTALKEDADYCILSGDLLDLDQISPFGRERTGALLHEYMWLLNFVDRLRKRYKAVWIITGNHEFRVVRELRKKMNVHLHFLVADLMETVSQGIELSTVTGRSIGQREFNNVHYRSGTDSWWVMIGDAVVAHPQNYTKADCSTAIKNYLYFKNRHNDDLRCSMIAHTHTVAEARNADRLCVEHGCMCGSMRYTKEGRITYATKPVAGYGVIYQKDGVTDLERTTFRMVK